MQLRHLKTFMTVATTLNFTRASERVHLSQSSVTEQIQALEADLCASLFDRTGRKLKLTPAGRRLLEFAGDLLDLAEDARSAVADAAGNMAGRLTVGGLETLCAARLPALIAEFHQCYPAVELILKAADSNQMRRGIATGAFDVCFYFGAAVAVPKLRSVQVSEEPLVIIVPPNHRLSRNAMVTAADLIDDAFLVTETGCVYRQMFEEAFATTLPDRPVRVGEFASLGAIRSLVQAGLGCALVPRLIVPETGADIGVLPWTGGSPVTAVTMAWRHKAAQPPALRLFLDMARASGFSRPAADHRRREAGRL